MFPRYTVSAVSRAPGDVCYYWTKVLYNFGEAPFQHAPPAADYQAFVAFEA